MQPQSQITATPDELLAVVREMFPAQYDRCAAELTIRKQAEEIDRLTHELADRADETHGHSDPHY